MKSVYKIFIPLFLLVMLLGTGVLVNTSFAQPTTGGVVVDDINLDIDDSIDIHEIRIPFFGQVELGFDEYATIWSWLTFIGGLISIFVMVFWVGLILRAAFLALKSEGSEEGMGEAMKKMQSAFIGAGISIAFPVALSLIGAIMGIGSLWQWPKALRGCPRSEDSAFFFQQVLRESDDPNIADPTSAAESTCYVGEAPSD